VRGICHNRVPPPLDKKGFSKKYKTLVIVSLAIIIVVVILVSPIVPIQYTVTKTRNVSFEYSAGMYGTPIIGDAFMMSIFVNVTNKDSTGGTFAVTIKYWNIIGRFLGQPDKLIDTSSQSKFIDAGATQKFLAPNSYTIASGMNTCTYSASAPSKQENYNVTQTKYESILNLIGEKQ